MQVDLHKPFKVKKISSLVTMSIPYIIFCVSLAICSSISKMCPESVPTVSVVPRCPSNAKEWVSAAKQKSCNELGRIQTCTNPAKFVYHCVLNKQATQLLEVCAPTWFLTGYCARFSEEDKGIINKWFIGNIWTFIK